MLTNLDHGGHDRMPEHTTPSFTAHHALPPLLSELFALLRAHRSAFRQERTFLRAQALLVGHLFCFARRTITQALVALGITEGDWSAFYRLFSVPARIDYEKLSGHFLEQTLRHISPQDPYVAVVDGVQIARHSHKMPGSCWLKSPRTPPFMPGIHRAQRFAHLACLLPQSQTGYSRALPLRWECAFTEKAVPSEGVEPKKEWEAGLDAIGWLRERLDLAGRRLQRLLVVADGAYCVKDLFRRLPARATLMARCARNRALYELAPVVEEKRRGRKRIYGDRAPRPSEWLHRRGGWRQTRAMVRGRELRLVHRAEGPHLLKGAACRPVFLLVVKGTDRRAKSRRQREPAFFLVGAVGEKGEWVMPFDAQMLLSWAWQRWEVEVSHREMKTSFGIGEAQCWNTRSVVMALRWRAWCYGAMVLAGFRAWGLAEGPIRPAGRWWRGSGRWSLGTLWRGYRKELWGSEEFRPLWTGTGDDYYRKEALMAGMNNAVFGSLRG
jgi:DDE superfamily endonuclease